MKILLVEDDKRVASFIRRGLREENYTVDASSDGEEGLFMAQSNKYDLIVLDLMLPKKTGLEVLATLRKEGSTVPVLILTAKDKPSEKVAGLDTGADDYLVKPFLFEEFLARIRALLRRSGDIAPAVTTVGDLEVDTKSRKVKRAGEEIILTSREYALLEFFLRNTGKVVTRTMLAENIWEHDFDTFSNVIDVLVSRLRKKIDDGHKRKLLTTVRGSGYLFQ